MKWFISAFSLEFAELGREGKEGCALDPEAERGQGTTCCAAAPVELGQVNAAVPAPGSAVP